GQRDQLLDLGLDGLGLGLGRHDPLVLDDLLAEVHEQRLAVGAVAAELVFGLLVSHRRSAQSWRRFSPRACSVSITSSIDFLPKLGIAFSSASDFEIRSPTVWIPARLRQLYERTPSSSSSIRMPHSSPCRAAGEPPPPTARPWPSSWPPGPARSSWMRSASVKIASWEMSSSAASRSAACGSIDPSVSMSSVSLSKSVFWPTRACSTAYATRRTGEKIESMGITP